MVWFATRVMIFNGNQFLSSLANFKPTTWSLLSRLSPIATRFELQKKNAVCVPLDTSDFDELLALIEMLPFAGIQLAPTLIDLCETRLAQSGSTQMPSIFQNLSWWDETHQIEKNWIRTKSGIWGKIPKEIYEKEPDQEGGLNCSHCLGFQVFCLVRFWQDRILGWMPFQGKSCENCS